jgi:hypothetical protein
MILNHGGFKKLSIVAGAAEVAGHSEFTRPYSLLYTKPPLWIFTEETVWG